MKPARPFTSASRTRKLPTTRSGASRRRLLLDRHRDVGAHHPQLALGRVPARHRPHGWWTATGRSSASAVRPTTARPATSAPRPSSAWQPPQTVAATGRSPATAASSLRRRPLLRIGRQAPHRPSSAWPPPPTARATGRWPPTAASSLRRRRLLRLDGQPRLNAPIVGMEPPPTARATGRWPPTAASSTTATPATTGRRAASTSTSPSSAWQRPPTATATGWRLATGASSPSATPVLRLDPGAGPGPGLGHHGHPRREGLLGSGHRRRGLPPWRRRAPFGRPRACRSPSPSSVPRCPF